MRIYDIIEKKANKLILTRQEIAFVINGFVKGKILNEQMSSLLMAIKLNGMTDEETYFLTKEMQATGKTYSFDFDVVDKHSTGGVGDSTTLLIAPILACQNLKVAKMSGSSLGITGGTVDKLSIFKGYNLKLSEPMFKQMIIDVGASIISQSKDIAIADKLIYDLRNSTATIESIPLIASSIMSKKLASGSNIILLDVKYGRGAFMKTVQDAEKLAKLMIKIGKMDNKKVWAILSNMNTPLCNGIGSSLEVYSVLEAINGKNCDLLDLSKQICALLIVMAKNISLKLATKNFEEVIANGKAKEKLKEMILYNNGDCSAFENCELLKKTKYTKAILSTSDGFVTDIDAFKLALATSLLKDCVDDKQKNYQGVYIESPINTKVQIKTKLATIYSDTKISSEIIDNVMGSFKIGNKCAKKRKLIEKIIKK